MGAASGALALQPYISLSMNVIRSDRSAHALEAQLASLAAAGDDTAFTTLVTRYQPAVFRWGLMFARDPDEAEDITQEVFVRAHRQLSQYRSDGSLEAWLYAITRRAARARRLSQARELRQSLCAVPPRSWQSRET